MCVVLVTVTVVALPSRRPNAKAKTEAARSVLDSSPTGKETVTADEKPLQQLKSKQQKASSNAPKRVHGIKPSKKKATAAEDGIPKEVHLQPMLFYLSLTATTEIRAKAVYDRLQAECSTINENRPQQHGKLLPPQLHDLSYIDFDNYFITPPTSENKNVQYIYLILIPSYNIDSVLSNFLIHLSETHHDFRIDTAPLSPLAGYSVFGFGDREGWPDEEQGFCYQAKEVDMWMAKLTARKRAFPLGMGDVKGDWEKRLEEWYEGVVDVMKDVIVGKGLGEGVEGSGDPVESDDEEGTESSEDYNNERDSETVPDLEDIGGNPQNMKRTTVSGEAGPIAIDFTSYGKPTTTTTTAALPAPKEMVPTTSPTYTSLTKQGYTIVGSHSGVKICRWTKSALRGRGSCYKNSFYGIKSHLCMETTPSLSCSNKCVFCWRHGTNPVGTTWRWKVDPPEMIFEGVKEGHYRKIKLMRGVPGVRAERFQEAMRIRHCGLSLVGEPIFYPHINAFLGLLHKEHISSFLVCNAQHPDQLANLDRVTQLYVSIDAADRDSLRRIDRPLHRDFWERFMRCLDILKEKRDMQRTVYRLTLVKGFNVDEAVKGYADLIERGLPCFIEVKGVTYCGTATSAGAGLTMKNVPFYHEVVEFVQSLNTELESRGLEYGIGAEHAHSCCILLASRPRFYVNGKWHTRINYDRFFELLEKEKKGEGTFRPEDYMMETEEWATFGKGGFDPNDTRWYRKKGKKVGDGEEQQPIAIEI